MRVGIYPGNWLTAASSPAALSLQARLTALSEGEEGLKLTALAPTGVDERFSGIFNEVHEQGQPGQGLAALWFDHKTLPWLAQRAEVDLLWTMGRMAPLRSPVPVVVELLPEEQLQGTAGIGRLRRAMAEAGAAGASLHYAWSDMDFEGDRLQPQQRLQPFVADAFRVTAESADKDVLRQLELPPAYVLAHLDPGQSVEWLLAAWSWVDASVGDQIPLVLAGLDPTRLQSAKAEIKRLDLEGSVQIVPDLTLEQAAPVYRGCDAFLQAGPSQTGQEIRWALATGAPIAALEMPQVAAIAGGAAYLTPPGDARALGAACLTLLVEPKEMAEPLRQKGLMRASAYHGQELIDDWRRVLLGVVS